MGIATMSNPTIEAELTEALETLAGAAELEPWTMRDRLTELARARIAVGTSNSPAIWEIGANAASFDDFFSKYLRKVKVSPFVRRFFAVTWPKLQVRSYNRSICQG